MRRLAIIGALGTACVVWAHDADVIAVQLEALSEHALRETVSMTATTLAQLAPLDRDGDGLLTAAEIESGLPAIIAGIWGDMPLSGGAVSCQYSQYDAQLAPSGLVTLSAVAACPSGELRHDFRLLRVLPANYRVEIVAHIGAHDRRAFAQGSLTSVSLGVVASPLRWREAVETGVRRWAALGVLSALVLLALAARRAQRVLHSTMALLVGMAIALPLPLADRVGALGLAAVAVVLAGTEALWWVGAVMGLCIGLTLDTADSLLLRGLESAAAWSLCAGWLVGAAQLFGRVEPAPQVRWGLAALACFAAGFNLTTV